MEVKTEKERERVEEIELNKFNEAFASNNPNILEQFIKSFSNSKKIGEMKEKIELLRKEKREKDIDSKQTISLIESLKLDFNLNKTFVNDFYKKNKNFQFSDIQKIQIEKSLRICWKEDHKAFFKKKKLAKITEFPWTDIMKWLGEERTKKLFSELNLQS